MMHLLQESNLKKEKEKKNTIYATFLSLINIFCILNSYFVCDFFFFFMYNFIGKKKIQQQQQQAVEEHSNVSFGGTYNTPICQSPNPYFYTSFTSAYLYC